MKKVSYVANSGVKIGVLDDNPTRHEVAVIDLDRDTSNGYASISGELTKQ